MSEVVDANYLVWIWRYGSPDVEGCDTLEDAVSWACAVEDSGEGSFWYIEMLGAGRVEDDAVRAIWDRLGAEADAAWEAASRPTHVAWLQSVEEPDRIGHVVRWASLGGFRGEPEWVAAAKERFGARLRITTAGEGRPR